MDNQIMDDIWIKLCIKFKINVFQTLTQMGRIKIQFPLFK